MNKIKELPTQTQLRCVVCDANAEQKCSNCHVVAYCTRQHQKQDWAKHKFICRPYKVSTDSVLGRHLVATRSIKAGQIIIKETPLISGPPQLSAPLCLGACGRLVRPPAVLPCDLCGWPLCGAEKCKNSKLHEPECFYTRQRGTKISISNYIFPHPNYQCVTVLRMLYQKENNQELWAKLLKLQSHCEERKGTEKYENDRTAIVQFIHRFFKLDEKFSEQEILQICGILQVNGHEVPLTEPPYVAIYEQTSMLEHSCRPNCCKSFTSNGDILIHAGQDIAAGDNLSICYTDSLWGTLNRRHYLFETKFFSCNCNRCSDPTEFGTFFSALKCTKNDCCKGFLLPETFLTDPSKEFNTVWKCSICLNSVTSNAVECIVERIGCDLNAMKKGDPHSCQLFLDYYGKLLHHNHFYLTDVRIALAQIIGQETEDGLNSTPETDIERKICICTKLIDLIQLLNPAEVRVRGTILFELHAAIAEIAKRRAKTGQTSPSEIQAMLSRSRDILTNAVHLLQHEPEELPEGKICIQARKNLQDMNEMLRTLHINIGDSPL